jgi:hypothetical protein
MAHFPRPSRFPSLVFGIAIAVGVAVGLGLTFLLAPNDASFESCVAREMHWQPHVNLPKVQRLCARHQTPAG